MKNLTMFALLIMSVTLSYGQTLPKKLYKADRVEIAPEINGDLDDAVWMNAKWEGDFTQFEPYEGRKPAQPTEFSICFDDLNLYVAFKAYDSAPDSITSRMSRRDNGDGDMVFLVFDSYHDLRTGFAFGVSSAGVRFDQIMSNNGNSEDPSWDPIWTARAKVHDWGWAAEMKIPLTQLRFEKNSTEVWGLEVARQIFRHSEMSFWQPIPRNSPGMIHAFGEMSGLEKMEPRKQFDLLPYGETSIHTSEAEAGNPFNTGTRFGYNVGLDAKIGITNNLTLDLTVNPDFGQVEADPSEVNLSAFESYFEEKRPFFIEGSNITSFGVGLGDGDAGNDNLFYSRRIGRRPHGSPDLEDNEYADIPSYTNILGAAKITGKTENGLSIGIIESITGEIRAEIDSLGDRSHEVIEPLTNFSLARVQKDFNKGNSILGAMVTSTIRKIDGTDLDWLHSDAHSAGIDFSQYFKEKNYVLNTSLFMSNVRGSADAIARTQKSSARYFQRPDADHIEYDPTRTSLSGHGGKMEFGKVGGNFNFIFMNIWKSPGFEINDIGFMREADFMLNVLWTGYNFTEPFSIFRSLNLNNDIYTGFDFGGNLNAVGYEWNINANFKNFWNGYVGGGFNGHQVSNTMLRGGPSMLMPNSWRLNYRIATDSRKKISASLFANYNRGTEANSSSDNYSASISIRPTNSLTLAMSPGYSSSMNELQYMGREELNGNDRYIFATVNQKIIRMSLRINYNITPDLTIQYWGQPFSGDVKFTDFKIITDSKAAEYADRFHTYTPSEITYTDGTYYVDNGDYSFNIDNPDFTFNEWLSNLVVRWEFKPGSTAFLVWSQTRSYEGGAGMYNLGDNLDYLFTNKKADNVFLIKFSYRIGLR